MTGVPVGVGAGRLALGEGEGLAQAARARSSTSRALDVARARGRSLAVGIVVRIVSAQGSAAVRGWQEARESVAAHGTGAGADLETLDPRRRAGATIRAMEQPERTPIGVLLWFGWSFLLLGITGLMLPRIIGFVDFSEKAPFSLLGVFMMAELALVIFGITVALQRKRVAWRFALFIALLPAPILAGLPPALLSFEPDAAAGWYTLFVPLGLLLSAVLIVGLLRPAARDYFAED
jgi:hypothetical protein